MRQAALPWGKRMRDWRNDPKLDRRAFLAGAASVIALSAAVPAARAQRAMVPPSGSPYPVPPSDASVEVLHGTTIPDPFRPLEQADRIDVQAWIRAHDTRARDRLAPLANRQTAAALIDRLRRYPAAAIPRRAGNNYFSMGTVSSGPQQALFVQEGRQGARRVLVDPNTMRTARPVAVVAHFPNRAGSLIAYSTSEAGGDLQDLRVRRVATGEDLPDRLAWCRHTTVAWLPDLTGFYYTRYPADDDPPGLDRLSQSVFLHKLGTPQASDRLVFRAPHLRELVLTIASAGGRDLLITGRLGTSSMRGLWVMALAGGEVTELLAPGRVGFLHAGSFGTTHYALTDLGAPRWRLVRFERANAAPEMWRTIVAESEATLDGVLVFRSEILLRRLVHGAHALAVHDMEGRHLYEVAVPPLSRVDIGRHQPSDASAFLSIESHLKPRRVDGLTLASGNVLPLVAARPAPETDDLAVEQVFVASRDGTRVPMTLIYRRGLMRDGTHRTLLYGYGGFGVSQWPSFNPQAIAWVRLGGVWAVASIRGGGEYGQGWHAGGSRRHKQASFDDFQAAAEWLVRERITTPARLAITGGSNGGLLTLACLLQRPEAFGAVVSVVPVADMIRFTHFTFGSYWKPEYGDPADLDDFKALIAYSPLHNVAERRAYPPLLVITADNDDRVVPAHTYKFVARLTTACPEGEVLMKVQTDAGHGARNTRDQTIERQSDTVAYLIDKLGGPVLQ